MIEVYRRDGRTDRIDGSKLPSEEGTLQIEVNGVIEYVYGVDDWNEWRRYQTLFDGYQEIPMAGGVNPHAPMVRNVLTGGMVPANDSSKQIEPRVRIGNWTLVRIEPPPLDEDVIAAYREKPDSVLETTTAYRSSWSKEPYEWRDRMRIDRAIGDYQTLYHVEWWMPFPKAPAE